VILGSYYSGLYEDLLLWGGSPAVGSAAAAEHGAVRRELDIWKLLSLS